MKQIVLTEKRFFEWHEDDKSVTLRNKSGSYGGGVRSVCDYTDIVGSICARDCKGYRNDDVYAGKVIVEYAAED